MSNKKSKEQVKKKIAIADGVEQVCMDGVEIPSREISDKNGNALVVAEHSLTPIMHAIVEDDEITAGGWKKRVVIVTGGTSGIGLEIARRFTLYADVVYNLDLNRQEDDNINFIKCDVTKPSEINAAVRKVYEKEEQIDILINNAGIGHAGSAERTELDDIRKVFDTNYVGTSLACAAVIPYMRERKRGTIFNIASIAGIYPPDFQATYSASKSAIITFTKELREEIRPFGIQATAVVFSNVKTPFTENRIKNKDENDIYKYRMAKAISKAEFDEQNGKTPEWIARKMFTLSNKKRLSAITILGMKENCAALFSRKTPYILIGTALVAFIFGFIIGL